MERAKKQEKKNEAKQREVIIKRTKGGAIINRDKKREVGKGKIQGKRGKRGETEERGGERGRHLLLVHHHRLHLPEGRKMLLQILGRRPAGEAADEKTPKLLGAPLGPEAPPPPVFFAAEVILQTRPCEAGRQNGDEPRPPHPPLHPNVRLTVGRSHVAQAAAERAPRQRLHVRVRVRWRGALRFLRAARRHGGCTRRRLPPDATPASAGYA